MGVATPAPPIPDHMADVKLRLLQFCERGGAGKPRVGVQLQGGVVVDVAAVDSSIPTDMKTFLQNFQQNTAAAEKFVCSASWGL